MDEDWCEVKFHWSDEFKKRKIIHNAILRVCSGLEDETICCQCGTSDSNLYAICLSSLDSHKGKHRNSYKFSNHDQYALKSLIHLSMVSMFAQITLVRNLYTSPTLELCSLKTHDAIRQA